MSVKQLMKSISIAPILALALAYAGNVNEPTAKHTADAESILDDEDLAVVPNSPQQKIIGLQFASLSASTLQTGALQPSAAFV